MDALPHNSELYADDNRGIYIPQHFAQSIVREKVKGVTDEQYGILEAGPDHDDYWEVWDEVCRDAVMTKDDGTEWTLYQDGALWLVPKDAPEPRDPGEEVSVVWNLQQLDLTLAEARELAARGVIYDPHEGDPESEVDPETIFYPEDTDDDVKAPEAALDRVETALKELRSESKR